MMILQIFLISSLLLNSFLLIYLFGLIPFLLFLSVVFNTTFLVYMHFLLKERAEVQADFSSLLLRGENFTEHLKSIYELEMFYGDETLESLITHSRELIRDFYNYEDKYFTETAEEDLEIKEENVNSGTEDQNEGE